MVDISVIVPVYKVEQYIIRCLESISKQTFANFEILAIDDGSPDHSADKIKEYQAKESRLQYYYKKNGGLGSARNYGIHRAKGKYICFIDSDDYIDPYYLEKLYQEAVSTNADIVCCALQQVNDSTIINVLPVDEESIWSFETPSACNKLFRRQLFVDNQIYFPEALWYEDLATIPKLLMIAHRVAIIKEPLYNYYVNAQSITHTYTKKVMDMEKVLQTLRTFYEQKKLEQYYYNMEYIHLYAGIINTTFRMLSSNLFSKREVRDWIYKIEHIYPNCYRNPIAKKRFSIKLKIFKICVQVKAIGLLKILVKIKR